MQKLIRVKGMHCRSCELKLEDRLVGLTGVTGVQADSRRGRIVVSSKGKGPDEAAVAAAVKACGYEVGEAGPSPWLNHDLGTYGDLAWGAAGLLAVALIAWKSGAFSWNISEGAVSLPLVLLIGLVAGVSTCGAVVGGLVVGLAARFADAHPEATAWRRFRPHLLFNLGRVVGFALFGAALGGFGSFFRLSGVTAALLMAMVGVVMLGLGLKLTRVSPRLDDWLFTLPTGLARTFGAHRAATGYRDATAALSGALTFFLPCGFTQAVQLYAMGTGSAAQGAVVMAVFALGTAPALLGLAGLVAAVRGLAARRFFAGIGLLVLCVGAYSVWHGARVATGALHRQAPVDLSQAQIQYEAQTIRMEQRGNGYFPSELTVHRGRPVRWVIDSKSEFSCASSIVIPQLGITKDLKRGENVIEFTPTEDMDIGFSCSMGMYNGKIKVID